MELLSNHFLKRCRSKLESTEITKEIKDNSIHIDEAIDFTLFDINSTSVINICLYLFLFSIINFIPQSKLMIIDYINNINFEPIWTTFLMCLLSFSFYTFSRLVKMIREKKNKVLTPKKDGIYIFMGYSIPLILQAILLVKADSFIIFSWIFLVVYALIFYFGISKVSKTFELKLKYVQTYERRICNFAKAIGIITFSIIIFYFIYTSTYKGFDGTIGIGVFDILILAIISFRGLIALLYYCYYSTPNLQYIYQSRAKHLSFTNYFSIGFLFVFSSIFVLNLCQTVEGYNNKMMITTETIFDDINRMSINQYAAEWIEEKNDNSTKNIYLVAGQGGGSRAGLWTSAVLNELESEYPGFHDNCFAISTVSGSSVGAAVYYSAYSEENYNSTEMNENLREFFQHDFISGSILRLIFFNPIESLGQIFCSIPNRNKILIREEEYKFNKTFVATNAYSKKFPLVYEENKNFDNPLLFLNTYNVTDKRKSVISSVKLKSGSSTEDLIDTLLRRKQSITLSQAVNLSQMFPIMSASSTYNNKQYFDGGTYDNSGMATIRDIYKVIAKARDQAGSDKKIVVLYLKNSNEQPTEKLNRSSIATLMTAASGSIFYANPDKHIEKLNNTIEKYRDQKVIPIVFKGKVTLNRWIGASDSEDMIDSAKIAVVNLRNKLNSESGRTAIPTSHQIEIFFNENDSKLDASAKLTIEKLIEDLEPKDFNLYGFADQNGTNKYNEDLITKRLNAVQDHINKLKNVEDCCTVKNEGRQGGKSDFSRQMNRKVVIKFNDYTGKKYYFPIR